MNLGIPTELTSLPGNPAGFNSNAFNPAPEIHCKKVQIPVNGVSTYRPNGVLSFNIDAGSNAGIFKRQSGYITFDLEVKVGTAGGAFPTDPYYRVNTFDLKAPKPDDPTKLIDQPRYYHNIIRSDENAHEFATFATSIPRFKYDNPSALKNTQTVRINNMDLYVHNGLNVLLEQQGALNNNPAHNSKRLYTPKNTHWLMHSFDTPNRTVRYSVSMPLDCPLLDHAYQDFPLFLLKSSVSLEIKLENRMEYIFDQSTAPVDSYEISNVWLNYDKLIVGTAFEENMERMLKNSGKTYEIIFNSHLNPNIVRLKGDKHQFSVNGVYSSVTSVSVVPYTTYTFNELSEAEKSAFPANAALLLKVNDTASATPRAWVPRMIHSAIPIDFVHEPALRHGVGIYDYISRAPQSVNVIINGQNAIERQFKPSAYDIRTRVENLKYASGTVLMNTGVDMVRENMSYAGVSLNLTKILDNDMVYTGLPSTGTITVQYEDNPYYASSAETGSIMYRQLFFNATTHSLHGTDYPDQTSGGYVNGPVVISASAADGRLVPFSTTLKSSCSPTGLEYPVTFYINGASTDQAMFTSAGNLQEQPYGGRMVKFTRKRELYTFITYTKAIHIGGDGSTNIVM